MAKTPRGEESPRSAAPSKRCSAAAASPTAAGAPSTAQPPHPSRRQRRCLPQKQQQPPVSAPNLASLLAADEQRRRACEAQRLRVLDFQRAHGWLPRSRAGKRTPFLHSERGLGTWCRLQRRRWAGAEGPPLLAEEAAALEAIPGWCWPAPAAAALEGSQGGGGDSSASGDRLGSGDAPANPGARPASHPLREQWRREQWELLRQRVAAFQRAHGHLPRTTAGRQAPFLPHEKELGRWCANQRRRWKGGDMAPLSPEEVAALQTIPGWWWEQQPDLARGARTGRRRQRPARPRRPAQRSGASASGRRSSSGCCSFGRPTAGCRGRRPAAARRAWRRASERWAGGATSCGGCATASWPPRTRRPWRGSPAGGGSHWATYRGAKGWPGLCGVSTVG